MQSWEGRFKSQALFDDRALLSCVVYVYLNPFRVRIAPTPEQPTYTSIKNRIYRCNNHSSLESFVGINRDSIVIPYRLKDYLELVDLIGRIIRDDKRGNIKGSLPKIFDRLSLDTDSWIKLTTQFEDHFQSWVSS